MRAKKQKRRRHMEILKVKLDEIIKQATDKAVAELVVGAIKKLFDRDKDLFEIDANERSITHRLGIYLQERFSEWDVDCEYNRDGHKIKYLEAKFNEVGPADDNGKTIFPDIIVHKRKEDKNKLIIEIKKASNPLPKCVDIEKLRAISKRLNYENALFLRLTTSKQGIGVAEFCWVNG
jgi:hypothetical protein